VAGPIQGAPAREVVAGQIAPDVHDGDAQTTGEQVGTEAGDGSVGGTVGTDLVRVAPATRPRDPHGAARDDGVVEVSGDPHTSGLGTRRHRSVLPPAPHRWPEGVVGHDSSTQRGLHCEQRPPDPSIGGLLAAGSCCCPRRCERPTADEPSP
jgi:hypothetical protein